MKIMIPQHEYEIRALPAQGAGGQNVNKVATAIQLRFDIMRSSLPEPVKQRIINRGDHRITREGVLVIKAQTHRTQVRNRTEALKRLHDLIASAWRVPAPRKPTRPSKAARARRLEGKTRRGQLKSFRKKIDLS